MNLYIHLPTNLEIFKLFLENKDYLLWWKSKDEKNIAWFFMKNFPWEVMEELSSQYETNFMSIRKLKQFDNNIMNNIQWVYYWSDNCEYLFPTKHELQNALKLYEQANKKYFFKKWKKGFVLTTPYVWNKMLERAKDSLDFLNEKWSFEVVVNDLWVLYHIKNKCPNLKPIVWRLFHKLLKTPLVDTYWNNAHVPWESMKNKTPWEIKTLQDEIVKNQNEFYNSMELSFPPYLKFLQKNNIQRVGTDFLQSRNELYKKDYQKDIDLYYPYACIFTGRLCDTSAIENEERWNFATNDVCPRTCWKYDIFYKIKTVGYKLLQRWNAWFRIELDLENIDTKFLYKKHNRLVFAPFVSV